MAEQYITVIDWQWTQGNYGFKVIFSLVDKDHSTGVDLNNYDFVVNVQRGEDPSNVYQAPCNVIDIDTKRIEYDVRKGDLSIGDEYYYIEVQGHKKNPLNDSFGDIIKISSQEVIRVFVRSAKESSLS